MSADEGDGWAMSMEVIKTIRNSVVAIGIGQQDLNAGIQSLIHIGTAFCFKSINVFLTCHHVLKNTPQTGEGLHVMINVGNQGTSNVYVVKGWEPVKGVDLAVFNVDGTEHKFEPLEIDADQLIADGTDILLYGYPESILQWTSAFPNPRTGSPPGLSNPAMFSRASRGIVSAQYALDNEIIEHDIETFPGLSGSPIVKISNKKVIGVNKGHRSIGKRDEYQGPKFAIRIQTYLQQIDNAVKELELKTAKK